MKSWLQDNNVEMCSTCNEGRSVAPEILIRTLNNKIYKHMFSVFKNVYIDKLADIVNKYNNIYHSTIKMRPVHVKSSTYVDYGTKNNEQDSNFKVDGHVKI